MSDKTYTIELSRDEVMWHKVHLEEGVYVLEARIKKLSEPAGKVLTSDENKELTRMTTNKEEHSKFILTLEDMLRSHDAKRLELADAKRELQECVELCDEPEAREAARQALLGLPDNPTLTITYNRNTLKFSLNLIENDLQKLRASIIPRYEKADASEFTDPIRTKSYYVNRARRIKNTLERMKIKMEKGL